MCNIDDEHILYVVIVLFCFKSTPRLQIMCFVSYKWKYSLVWNENREKLFEVRDTRDLCFWEASLMKRKWSHKQETVQTDMTPYMELFLIIAQETDLCRYMQTRTCVYGFVLVRAESVNIIL